MRQSSLYSLPKISVESMFPYEYGVLGCGWVCVMGSEHFPAGWGSLMPHHRDLMLMVTGHAR